MADTAADERWLAATWPFVREVLPAAPARILEVGCGPLGGLVPRMRALGHDAVGVDPEAPDGAEYRRGEVEWCDHVEPVDALVACRSLHHVADLDVALDRINSVLAPGGAVVVVEWARERFDEATARWCFARLPARETWLHHHRQRWRDSGQSWDRYFRDWAEEAAMHPGQDILLGLQDRFETEVIGTGPYFFADLDGVSSTDEQAAIAARLIQANGVHYVGRRGDP